MRIFLGAAPGVGKTFEMLTQGRRRRLDGTDVVIGVVETHGREETEALTKGFEIIPKKRGLYKGRVVAEMDLDAILQRRPGLVLVDELAHSNIEGSRHPKRYLDVEELLAAGIDVFTTVNIQHIESLNDVIAQITRIHVRETIPDAVLDEADEIELVDLTADDLLKRLREGKVYVKAQAERGAGAFFLARQSDRSARTGVAQSGAACRSRHDRLHAGARHRRPLAGQRADTGLHQRTSLLCGTGPAGAPPGRRPESRMDRALHRRPAPCHAGRTEKDRIADTLRLAEKLGGQTASLPGRDIADAILTYARRNNVTQIIIAKSERPIWFELLHGSVVRDLIRNSGAISVSAISPRGETIPPKKRAHRPENGTQGLAGLSDQCRGGCWNGCRRNGYARNISAGA